MVCLSTLTVLTVLSAPTAGETVLLDFGASWCGPCRMMEPTVRRLEAAGYPVRKVDIDRDPQLAARYGVGPVPCFVLVADGREIDRVVGRTTYARLERMFQKADQARAASHLSQVRGQPPDVARDAIPFPGRNGAGPPTEVLPKRDDLAPESGLPEPPMQRPRRHETDSRAAGLSSIQRALAASVRVKVEDPRHDSYGSGTIIHTHGDEALVLTCGHIFRPSQGRGRIVVDLFVPGSRLSVPGQLFGCNLQRDIALVVIRPGVEVTPVVMASTDHRIQRGDRICSIGCDRGGQPRLQESRVTAVDQYVGPANVEVAAQPVLGRSGGGLFTRDGKLIGVCSRRHRHAEFGLYAALSEIHNELTEAHLSDIFDHRDTAHRAVADRGTGQPGPRNAPDPFASRPRPAPAPARGFPSDQFQRLTRSEQAVVEALRRRGADAEVICIVRSGNSPESRSEVFGLQRPSQAFLNQLAREFEDQQHGYDRTTSGQVSNDRRSPGHRRRAGLAADADPRDTQIIRAQDG